MAPSTSLRAGRYVWQSTGDRAFISEPLPPQPPLEWDGELHTVLSDADRDLARLDAIASLLPNPDLFVAMYVRHEAVLSSQIEGTQSTLEDVLALEAQMAQDSAPKDAAGVVTYVRAMNHGLRRLPALPRSLRLLREVHAELMAGARGGDKSPGEFRATQNWIGPAHCTLANAAFVPPPPHEVMNTLGDLEKFIHAQRGQLPLLIQCGLVHAQFETIHPFLDGNGRIGRLLVTLMLCEEQALSRPLLYLSLYLKTHRAEYYDRLTAVRHHGHWKGWLKFFLRGISLTARPTTQTARNIVALRDAHRAELAAHHKNTRAPTLLDALYRQPYITINTAAEIIDGTFPTAAKLVRDMQTRGWLLEITGQGRNRLWRYQPYLDLFHRDAQESSMAAFHPSGAFTS